MTTRIITQWTIVLVLFLAAGHAAHAQGTDLIVSLSADQASSPHHSAVKRSDVVVWLTPVDPGAPSANQPGHNGPFRLVQKDKKFSPHLLVVPTGASVEFPNRDPFFHNVFSLFNGKRFDLGLYESGSSRSVRFDREGVSYIFCNIHPEMGAVVLALSTPFYAVSTPDGVATIAGVPPGAYRLHLWSETAQPANAAEDGRLLQVGSSPLHLAPILLRAASNPMQHHLNKFGEEYRVSHEDHY